MKYSYNPKRRSFLKFTAGLASLGISGLGLLPRMTSASTFSDYKALVCIYLNGGNDGNNLIVPLDNKRYNAYQNIRGALALTGSNLLAPITDSSGNPYGLHYGLVEMNPLYSSGQLAIVLNTGTLVGPLSQSVYLQGLGAPTNLYSHSDQTVQTQTGQPTPNGKGWGGLLLDNLGGAQDSLAAVSVSTPSLLLQGNNVSGNVVTPGSNLSLAGMDFWDQNLSLARRQAANQIFTEDGGFVIRQVANQAMSDGLKLGDALKTYSSLSPLTTVFPGTDIGNQLQQVMSLIRLRSQQGPGRQVFFCSLDGFDTHSSQSWQQWNLFVQLSQAMNAFYLATQETGLAQQVTSFTQSEFGRTLQSNGTGSDHAWGNHQLVLGGAVKGGIYGQMPDFTLNGVDDANGRGAWIPKIATTQFAATLGNWFGASATELAAAFPNLGLFASSNVGFI